MTRTRPSPTTDRPFRFTLAVLTLAICLLLMEGAAPAAIAQEAAPPDPDQPILSASRFEQVAEGKLRLTGDVEMRYGEMRLLADTLEYDDTTRMAKAEGNVVLMFGQSQISGDRLELNVDTRFATVWHAHGFVDPDIVFTAEKIERVADDKVVLTDGTVTTCTQPTPYWSFHVSKATLHLDHYAHMRGVAMKVGAAPVFYTPYLVWPMKKDRSSGLLLPNVGYSRRRGSFIGNALYVVLGRSQDVTLFYDRYGKTGTGFGYEYRFVPAPGGQGTFLGYYLEDTVEAISGAPPAPGEDTDRKRYRFKYTQTQTFGHGYRLLADLNKVSDLDYYLDFERDITQTTSPTILSQIDIARNWRTYSMNMRLDRQEQFLSTSSDLTLQRLPELELRGRGIRFGRSPFYLSFESSAVLLNKERNFLNPFYPQDPADPNSHPERRETTYARVDLYPTISASFTPTPWLDISPSIAARETFYTRSLLDPNDELSLTTGEDIRREFARFDLSVVGPRFFRLFGDAADPAATRWKHTFEPHANYTYVPEVSGGRRIIPFDELDALRGDLNQVAYGLTSRLFARRPEKPAAPPAAPIAEGGAGPGLAGPAPVTAGPEGGTPAVGADETRVQVPVADVKDLPEELKAALRESGQPPAVGAVEVATFDIRQIYSLDPNGPLSVDRQSDPSGVPTPLLSRASDLVASVRYNPAASTSLDVAASWNVNFRDIESVSVSANLRSLRHGYARLSWFLNRDLGEVSEDQSQVRLIGGTAFLRRKITLDLEGSYDIEQSALRDQRYRLGYNTQCCGMLMEVAKRDFDTIDEIEYRFVLNLRGVGTFLDLQGRPR